MMAIGQKTFKPKTQSRCIFCSGKNLTKQHILPQWLGREFKDLDESHTIETTELEFKNATAILTSKIRTFNGPYGSRKIKNVCGYCNGGWMSRLETRCKPIIISLLNNDWLTLDAKSCRDLSAWIMMTTIMQEYTQIASKAITPEDRGYLKENLEPSATWEIWIARSQVINRGQKIIHAGVAVIDVEDIREWSSKEIGANTQSTIIWLQRVVFYARSKHSSEIQLGTLPLINEKFCKIWPLAEGAEIILDKDDMSLHEIQSIVEWFMETKEGY